MDRRKLPIGIQTFRRIREDGHYYVDKTGYAKRLVDEGTHHFLSRPRRFGKSLFVDTLKELFEGSEALFEGLAVHGQWDWSVRHPVVRLSFARGNFKRPGYLDRNVAAQLDEIEEGVGLVARYPDAPERFAHLIRTLHERTGRRVVVLVDECDKPILDALGDPEQARANRDDLRGFYSAIKDSDTHVKFSLITGVSKFVGTSLFSGMNNLRDVTLDSRYSAICGYTEADLDRTFAPELDGLDRVAIREWYNGYSWLGEDRVYNPFGILQLFDKRRFGAWWFETGTPTFLVDLLKSRGIPSTELDGTVADDGLLSSFDIDNIPHQALLFQTGYLTIADVDSRGGSAAYRLGYPNREVRQALNRHLLRAWAPEMADVAQAGDLGRLLANADLAGLEALLRAFFASVPCHWHAKTPIADYEGHYATAVCSLLSGWGLDARVEDATSHGRIDLAVTAGGHAYLFEFKVLGSASEGSAMRQLREKGYADKYRGRGRMVHLVGVEFDPEKRNIATFETART